MYGFSGTVADAVEDRLARPLLHAEELVELVHPRPDLLLGLERHGDELAVLRGVQDAPEVGVLGREAFEVFTKPFIATPLIR